MQRLINTVGNSAAVMVLMAGLWQDWSLLTTLKRMLMAYLGFFFLASLTVLVVRIVPLFEKKEEVPEEAEVVKKRPKNIPA